MTRIAPLAAAFLLMPALAAAQNRPDLVDVFPNYTSPKGSLVFSAGHSPGFDSRMYANGLLSVFHSINNRGQLTFTLYEPDKIKRKGTDASVQQGAHVFVDVQLKTPSIPLFSGGALVAGCKAKAQVRAGIAIWKLSCPSTALASMGLSPVQQQAFKSIFGSTSPEMSGKGVP